MSLRINHNLAAQRGVAAVGRTSQALARSLERLSSGLRINRASDDAAGLTIGQTLRAQVRGQLRAQANCQDGISMVRTAEGALDEVTGLIQRMRELAVRAANDTFTTADRQAFQAEVAQQVAEIDNIASYTSFNGKALLDGTLGTTTLQVGANLGETLGFTMGKMTAAALGLAVTMTPITAATTTASLGISNGSFRMFFNGTTYGIFVNPGATVGSVMGILAGLGAGITPTLSGGLASFTSLFVPTNWSFANNTSNFASVMNLSGGSWAGTSFTGSSPVTINTGSNLSVATQAAAEASITTLDTALQTVLAQRSALGAVENRLEAQLGSLAVSTENQAAAESRIEDADVVQELSALTRQQILVQSGLAVVSQANAQPAQLLDLLREPSGPR